MKKNQGFTLIELIIVLSIVGVLSGYALPSFTQLSQNKKMDGVRNDLTVDLQFARNQAVMIQRNIIVCPSVTHNSCANDSNWHKGWIVFVDKNSDKEYNQNDELLHVGNATPKGMTVISSNHRKKIRFNGMGFSPGTNLSINFCDKRGDNFAKALIVSNSGRVKQSKPIHANVCNS